MRGERDGLTSVTGALLDRVRATLVQLNRDQESDPSESLEGHHLVVALQLDINAPFGLLCVTDKSNPAVHTLDMSVLTALHIEWLAPMMGIA